MGVRLDAECGNQIPEIVCGLEVACDLVKQLLCHQISASKKLLDTAENDVYEHYDEFIEIFGKYPIHHIHKGCDVKNLASALIIQVIKVYVNIDIAPTRFKLLSTKINYVNHYLIDRKL